MNYVLIPLEKLDVRKVTFGKVKEDRYKGKDVPLCYKFENKPLPLYLKVKGCVVPFGIKQNTELNSSKVNGYSLSISLDSKYSKKVAELDSHLISVIYENRASLGLGNKIPFDAISGYDEFGTDGKYKRVLMYPYRKENGVKVYELDRYLPRLDMKILSTVNTSPHKLNVDAFNESREKLPDLNECNYNETIPSRSVVNAVFSLSRISIGSYGVVLKPVVVRQLLVKKESILPTDATLLVDNNDDDSDLDMQEIDF